MMQLTESAKTIRLLEEAAKALDLTEAQYKAVVDRYEALANHLAADTSLLKDYKPDVKPQGSFLVGTMNKPVLETDTLDVDLVCRLKGKNGLWTQYDLKQTVGNQIKKDKRYAEMLDEEGNRCWTLVYAEATQFHMDILPALVGEEHFVLLEKRFSDLGGNEVQKLAFRITDKRLPNYKTEQDPAKWMRSNPFGYAGWFKERSRTLETKLFSLREAVESLPKYAVNKTILQRCVQLLKRHRDIMFGDDADKPISIIITTLAARSYNRELNIVDAMNGILSRMGDFVETRDGFAATPVKWVANPVNEEENFADKWMLEKNKEANFWLWLEKAKADFASMPFSSFTDNYRNLKSVLGSTPVNTAVKSIGSADLINQKFYPANFHTNLLSVSHRQRPIWPLQLNYRVEIYAHYKKGSSTKSITAQTPVPKGAAIYFKAFTNVPKPYEVYWQVVNNGKEAASANSLRGGIEISKIRGVGGVNQKEDSMYEGIHWTECFIVKNGVCVARSYEFFVSISS